MVPGVISAIHSQNPNSLSLARSPTLLLLQFIRRRRRRHKLGFRDPPERRAVWCSSRSSEAAAAKRVVLLPIGRTDGRTNGGCGCRFSFSFFLEANSRC